MLNVPAVCCVSSRWHDCKEDRHVLLMFAPTPRFLLPGIRWKHHSLTPNARMHECPKPRNGLRACLELECKIFFPDLLLFVLRTQGLASLNMELRSPKQIQRHDVVGGYRV